MLTVRSTINIASQTVPPIIPVVQGDTGRAILFTLADFTIPAGATATYYVQKPSGEAIYNNATIDGNNVLVNLTAQSIIEKGDNYGQVRIIVGEDVVTSFDFILLVKEFRGIDAVQSLTEMNIFDKAVEQAADAIDEVKTDALDDIGDAKEAALQEIEQSTGNFADDFSASATYAAGDYVVHSGQLYRFTANHAAGAWTGSDAEAVTVGEELTDLKAETTELKDDLGIITLPVVYKDGLYVDDGAFVSTRQDSQIVLIDLTSITGNDAINIRVRGNQNRARILMTSTDVANVASGTTGTYSDKNNASEFAVSFSEYRNYSTLAICTNFQSTPYASVYASTYASTGNDTIVDCWGDSLTQGAGATVSYPSKLQELIGSGKTVNNYGQGSETAEAIAFRQGGIPAIVEPFTTSTGYVELDPLISVDGMSLSTLNYSGLYNGNNIVTIDGTNFFYRRVSASKCKLARISGTDHTYTRPMLITAEGKGTKHIMIVCVGQNGWVNNSTETLAEIIKKMIAHNDYDKYIVVGIPTGDTSTKSAQEQILGGIFGGHYVNAREYISTWGCTDNNITPTSADTEAMAIGAIPPSLRNDSVHLNDYGYIAMANCVYARGKSLGYWD